MQNTIRIRRGITNAGTAVDALCEPLEPRRLLASSIAFEHILESIDGAFDVIDTIDATELDVSAIGFGHFVASIGDVDDDGVVDFAVGSSAPPSIFLDFAVSGVFVFSGATRERLFTLADGNTGFGAAIAAPGDVNGDGVPDLVVGSPRAFVMRDTTLGDEGDGGGGGGGDGGNSLEESLFIPGQGRAYVYSGVDGALLRTFDGTHNFGEFGHSLAVLRDINGDGVPELAIGAPGSGETSEGQVSVVDLVTGDTLVTLTGDVTLSRFGEAVGASQESTIDLIVGVPQHDGVGRVDLYAIDAAGGVTLVRTLQSNREDVGMRFGASVASFRPNPESGRTVTAVGSPGYTDPFASPPTPGQGLVEVFDENGDRFIAPTTVGESSHQGLGGTLSTLPALAPGLGEWLVVTSLDGSGVRFLGDGGQFDTLAVSPPRVGATSVDAARDAIVLPSAVAALADFDGDGIIDLVSAGRELGRVNITPGVLLEQPTAILGASGDGAFLWTERVIIHAGRLTPIEVYTGVDGLEVIDINTLGEILGIRRRGGDEQVVIIGGDTHEVITPDSRIDGLVPRRLSDTGVVVFAGTPDPLATTDTPLVVLDAGTFVELGDAVFADINASGSLVAHRDNGGDLFTRETITWSPGETAPTVVPGLFLGQAINDSGVIIGRTSRWVIASWDNGVITPYGTPNTANPNIPFAGFSLIDLNASGEFVGTFLIQQIRASPVPTAAFGRPADISLAFGTSATGVPFNVVATRIFDDGSMLTDNGYLRRIGSDDHIGIDPTRRPAATSAPGRIVLAGVNEFGDPVVFRLDAAAQIGDFDLPGDTAFPDVENYHAGDVVTWIDPVDGKTRIFTNDRILTLEASGAWSQRSIGVPFGRQISTDLTIMRTPRNTIMLVGLRFNGELVHYFQTGERDADGQAVWKSANLSREHFDLQGRDAPQFVGELTAYSTPWNSRHIVGLDVNGDLRGVWWSAGLNSPYWVASNLSDVTGVPAIEGTLAAFVTGEGQINIAGADAGGNLHRVSWEPGGAWQHENLTLLTAPAERPFEAPVRIEPDSLTGYVTPWGGVNFFGIDRESSTPVSFFLPPSAAEWDVFDFDDVLVEPAPVVVGALVGTTGPGVGHNLFATTPDGEAILFRWRAGDATWSMVPLRDLVV